MEILLEALLWPVGDAVGALLSGFWSILERDGKAGPEGVKARAVATAGPCAYCRHRRGLFVACDTCRAPHHKECARFNRRCAVFGCGNRKFLEPAA
jgi:hypothetical protein